MNNVEASVVALTMGNDTNTSHVTTTSNHGNDTSVELDEVGNLAGCEVDLDRVVDLDCWIRVTDTTQAKFRQHFGDLGIATVDLAFRSRWFDQNLDQRLNDV